MNTYSILRKSAKLIIIGCIGVMLSKCSGYKISYDPDYPDVGKELNFDEPLMYVTESIENIVGSNGDLIRYRLFRVNGEDAVPKAVRERHLSDKNRYKIDYRIVNAENQLVIDSSFLIKSDWFSKPRRYIVVRDESGTVSFILERFLPNNRLIGQN